jgi:hypothetical protein
VRRIAGCLCDARVSAVTRTAAVSGDGVTADRLLLPVCGACRIRRLPQPFALELTLAPLRARRGAMT